MLRLRKWAKFASLRKFQKLNKLPLSKDVQTVAGSRDRGLLPATSLNHAASSRDTAFMSCHPISL